MEEYKNKNAIGTIIKQELDGEVLLIEMPYDEGSRVSDLRLGASYAPEFFHKFISKVGPIQNGKYGVDLSKIKISIKTNVKTEPANKLTQLTKDIQLAIKKNQTIIVIGGSKDLVPYSSKGLLEYDTKPKEVELNPFTDELPEEPKLHKVLIIGITPRIDTDLNEPTTSSKHIWRCIMEDSSFSKSGSKVILFGTSSTSIKGNYDYFISKGGSVVWLNDIWKAHPESTQTKAGQVFEEILNKYKNDYKYIYVSFCMESLLVLFKFIVGCSCSWSI